PLVVDDLLYLVRGQHRSEVRRGDGLDLSEPGHLARTETEVAVGLERRRTVAHEVELGREASVGVGTEAPHHVPVAQVESDTAAVAAATAREPQDVDAVHSAGRNGRVEHR